MTGQYRNLKDIYGLAKMEFKAFRDDVIAGRLTTYRVIVQGMIWLMFVFNFVFLFIFCIKAMKKK
jgi:hypothetical protein